MALGPKPAKFGEQTTGDHLISRNKEKIEFEGDSDDDWFPGAKNGLVLYDRATDDCELYPVATRTHEETVAAMKHWQKPDEVIESFRADNAQELLSAARDRGWRNPTSTPGDARSNALAERMVRRVKQGTKINLSQSGLYKSWWPYAGRHYTFARRSNMVDGDSTYNKRHAQGHCKAKRIMFGQLVDYLPTPSPKETKRSKDFVNRTRTGLFVGYHIQPGCLWSGDYLVVDWEKLQSSPDATPGQCRLSMVTPLSNRLANPETTYLDGLGEVMGNPKRICAGEVRFIPMEGQ